MMDWKTEAFRYFIEGKTDHEGKTRPKGKTHGQGCNPLSWEDSIQCEVFGAILKENFIDISFDDSEMGNAFLKMRERNGWNCIVFENPLNNHIHTIWKDTNRRIETRSATDIKTAVGLIADVHGGLTYIRLREPDHDRFPPVIVPDRGLDEVPTELLPIRTKKCLWRMENGSGRNSELFGYIQVLQSQLRLNNEQCKGVLRNINHYIFSDPLSEDELQTVMRDDAFTKCEVKPLASISATDLLQMDIEPVYFVVDNLLPVGLSIIASPPKIGKSYLCTQLSLAVANGNDFMGFKTHENGVLYMALEDSLNRCKERILQELQGQEIPEKFRIMIDCPSLGNGLIDQLQDYLQDHPDTKLIIIDTFAKIRDGAKNNEGAYSADYREAGIVKKFADQNQIAVLLVHHTRKMKDYDDPFANISGTQGLTGACDTMLVLTKDKRSDELTKLSVTGRDIYQSEYGIIRDKESGIWKRSEDSFEQLTEKINHEMIRYQYGKSTLRKTILKLLETKNQWSGRCGELITASKEFGTPITGTPQKLAKMIEEYNPFLISEDKVYCTVMSGGTGSKKYRFEKCS